MSGKGTAFSQLADTLNQHLLSITGNSFADILNKDPFSNNFNIAAFVTFILFVASFFILCCIGLVHGCCESKFKKKTNQGFREETATEAFPDSIEHETTFSHPPKRNME